MVFKRGLAGALLAGLAACGGGNPIPSLSINTISQAEADRATNVVDLSVVPTSTTNGPTAGPEYFSSAAYGVAASPRVGTGPRMPRGGGRAMVGKPYKIAGRTYRPTENQKRFQNGKASWYGAAFHGRKTANGEVYDMNHLTAAHKTMPLPSYARVTNKANGRSIIVRVNDRGPFSKNRVIDLSKRAAELLDYIKKGTADVKVEYLGPAPVHGQDDAYLIASFKGAPTNRLPGVRNPALAAAETPQPVSLASGFQPEHRMSAYASQRVSRAFEISVSDNWKR